MSSIYIIKSKTSGKIYIGQTNSTTKKRWRKHLVEMRRRDGCSALYSAIKKYGVEDFEVKDLLVGDFSKKELNNLEKEYIKKYNSLSPYGYNLQSGGNSFNLSEEVKKKISKANKGRKITWSDKVSKGLKKLWEDPVYRKRMSDAHKGVRGFNYKKHSKPLRLKLDTEEINSLYQDGWSIYKLTKKYNVCYTTIQKRIKKK